MTEAFVQVLGIAQDGGVPQAGCVAGCCAAVRRGARAPQRVAALGVAVGARRYLLDATPDFPAQLHALAPDGRLDGVFLTHAHYGHYVGLLQLGREVMDTCGVPVHCTARMAAFLRANAPFAQLVAAGNVELCVFAPGETVALGDDVVVEVIAVPHRAEYTDTVGFRVRERRAGRAVLYVPDCDSWAAFGEARLQALVDASTVAYLDATFFSADELPGRDVAAVPHPLVTDTMHVLAGARAARVRLIHLNHTNRLLADPAAAAGLRVAAQDERINLRASSIIPNEERIR